jgi:cysteine desulfurase
MRLMEPIYLDYNATSPVAAEVLAETERALRDLWGNPSSTHPHGRRAREAVDRARSRVAELLGCDADEIVFTSGGTESDNAAVLGVAEASADRGRHVVISTIEHPAVGDAAKRLERRGFSVTRVPVDRHGAVDPDDVARAFRDDTVLVSIMHANNETGVLQPVAEIARAARARGIPVHTDAAQSVGKLPVSVDELGVDLLTIAGHKMYAPKGVGALHLRRGTPFEPFLLGAGHESGRRSGTENTPGIVGLGAACELARREPDRAAHLARLRDRLEAGLRRAIPDLVVHGGEVERLPNTLYAAIPGVPSHELLADLPGLATGSGAACHSGKPTPSRVLLAMGVPEALAVCTLRLSLGRPTTEAEVDRAVAAIAERVGALRAARR